MIIEIGIRTDFRIYWANTQTSLVSAPINRSDQATLHPEHQVAALQVDQAQRHVALLVRPPVPVLQNRLVLLAQKRSA